MTIERWTLGPTFEMPGGVVGEFERCCVVDGPIVPPGETVEVVRASLHAGAVGALRAIATYVASPHPEPCGTDACLLCLIEGTARNAIPSGR